MNNQTKRNLRTTKTEKKSQPVIMTPTPTTQSSPSCCSIPEPNGGNATEDHQLDQAPSAAATGNKNVVDNTAPSPDLQSPLEQVNAPGNRNNVYEEKRAIHDQSVQRRPISRNGGAPGNKIKIHKSQQQARNCYAEKRAIHDQSVQRRPVTSNHGETGKTITMRVAQQDVVEEVHATEVVQVPSIDVPLVYPFIVGPGDSEDIEAALDSRLADVSPVTPSEPGAQGTVPHPDANALYESDRGREPLCVSCLSIVGMVGIGLCLVFVGISAAKANDSQSSSNPDWESDNDAGVYTGALGLVLCLLAVPCQFLAQRSYLQTKREEVNPDTITKKIRQYLWIVIASWFLYAAAVIIGACLVTLGAVYYYVKVGWILGAGSCGAASWLLMFVYSEITRRL